MVLDTLDESGRCSKSASSEAVEEAGAFCVVLECVPSDLAHAITERLSIPTIGIGAGAGCDGQVLVWHDLLGLTSGHLPRFVKQYAQLNELIRGALITYREEVLAGQFPAAAHTYPMDEAELKAFQGELAGLDRLQNE